MRQTAAVLVGALALWGVRSPAAPLQAENFAARVTVTSIEIKRTYGGAQPAASGQFVILGTLWENRVDPKLAEQRGLAPGYGVDNLPQHLFLVVDGRALGALRGGLDGGDGRHSLEKVILPKSGSKVAGELVFEIHAGSDPSLDLRFYDDVAGDMKLALKGAAPAATPLHPAVKNAVGEFAVFGFEDPAPGVKSPPGFRAIAVDLRARSVWLSSKDAPAYDAATEQGTQVSRVNLLDWPEPRTYLHVLADGVYACALAEDRDLPDPLRYIPEFFTGQRFIFQVPAEAKSLELFAAMPHAATDDGTLDLAPVRVQLAGKSPAPAPFPGALKIKDDMFALAIGARRVAQFGGEPAGEGRIFVVLDVGATNEGTTGEFFQPAEQLPLLDADGSEVPPDALTSRGSHRPEGDKVHLPAGERRRFELVYRLDTTVAKIRLSFHGGSFAQTYDLSPAP